MGWDCSRGTWTCGPHAGGHVSYALLTNWGVLIPNARVDWVREFEDRSEALSYRFVNYQTCTGYDSFSIDEWNPGLRWEKTY